MIDKAFIDTNILIYTYSIDEPFKRDVANHIIEKYANEIIISHQVINELINILYKKFKLPSEDIENAVLEIDTILPIVSFDLTTQIKAIRLKDRYKLQYFDALIIATALENSCSVLFSEDMQHLQVIDETLTIINPLLENEI